MALIIVKANKGTTGNIIVKANGKVLNYGQTIISVRAYKKEKVNIDHK